MCHLYIMDLNSTIKSDLSSFNQNCVNMDSLLLFKICPNTTFAKNEDPTDLPKAFHRKERLINGHVYSRIPC